MNIRTSKKTKNKILAASAILGVIALLAVAATSMAPHASADNTVPDGYTPIYTFDDLMAINADTTTLSGNYILMNDITFTSANNIAFVPIGSSNPYYFSGIFDGNGHVISGMNVNISSSSSAVYAGLFGCVSGAQIMNLGVVDSTITATSSSSSSSAYAGGIVGEADSAIISNCYNTGNVSASCTGTSSTYAYAGGIAGCGEVITISNCYNTSSVSSSLYAGGIVGSVYLGSAIITNCYNTGDVSASATSSYNYASAGGIVGIVSGSATISNCYNTGDVSATPSSSDAYAGGIVGCANMAIITNCYNTGDVSATSSSYNAYAGGIVGDGSATISNCYNTGSVSASNTSLSPSFIYAYAGGIAGSGGGIISNCYNTGDVTASNTSSSYYAYAGGIVGCVGYGSAIISNCYNTGDVSASSTSTLSSYYAYAGGIAGSGGGIISNCYNTGDVTASNTSSNSVAYAGGIVGDGSATIITNCYNTGDVSGSATSSNSAASAGGIAGGVVNGLATITNCYFFGGSVSQNSVSEDKICGTDWSFTLNDGGTGDQASGAKTTEQMTPTLQDAQSGDSIYYVGSGGWDFSDNGVWTIVEGVNNGYPILQFHSDQSVSGGFVPILPYTPVSVVPDGYTPIYTFQDLIAINNNSTTLSGNYILMNDITFTDANNTAFVPIGSSSSSSFKGIFDGNGHEISGMNVNISSSSAVYAGLFGCVYGAQIMNLGVVDSTITATSSIYSAYSGGIVGCAGSAIISNCYNTGNVSALYTGTSSYSAYAGGIIGDASSAIISNCYNTGDVSATSSSYAYAGGIIGDASSAIISNCYNTGNVSASNTSSSSHYSAYAGGIAGYVSGSAIISNCYNTGNVSASVTLSSYAFAGGIVGDVGSAIISNCYNTGNVSASVTLSSYAFAGGIVGYSHFSAITMANCYNTGSVSASVIASSNSHACAGGIVGYEDQYSAATISNCYNTGSVSVTSSNTASAGGIVGYVYGSTIISNCYNTGDVIASATSSFYSAYAGGIAGYAYGPTIISNCYFLAGQMTTKGISSADVLGFGIYTNADDGIGDQASGAKTTEQMMPTLADAQNGNSIYYIGSGGWDFTNTWTIIEGANNGYPILSSLGHVGPDISTSYEVTLTPGTGYALTPVNGSSSPVESGGLFSFMMTVDPEYTVNCVPEVLVNGEPLTPISDIYTITNITEDQTVTVVFDSIIGSSSVMNGSSVTINGTIDPSAGATHVKVYITFSDGSVINSTFTIGPLGDFSTGYSGSMHVVSYLITAYDGKPGTSGVNMVAWTETNSI